MNSRHRFIAGLVTLAVVGYWVFMFYSTHMKAPALPEITNIDKVFHAGAYGLLAFGIAGIVALNRRYTKLAAISVWLVIVLYGCFDEYTQQFCEGRSPDVIDLLADAIGAFFGIASMFIMLRLISTVASYRTPALNSAVEI